MNTRTTSLAALLLGVLGFVLHLLYRSAAYRPETGLYAPHPLFPVLILVTLLAAVLGLVWGKRLRGETALLDQPRRGNALSDGLALADCGLYAAAGVLFLADALLNRLDSGNLFALYMPMLQGVALVLSGGLGIAARLGLVKKQNIGGALAFQTMLMGFACTIVLVYFYQSHGSDPVVVGFAWPILALAASALAWYEIAALTQKRGGMAKAGGLMVCAVVLCLMALADEMTLGVRLVLCGNAVWFLLMHNA